MATQGAHNPLLRVRVPPSQPVTQVWYMGCASAFQADELSSNLSTCSKFYSVASVTVSTSECESDRRSSNLHYTPNVPVAQLAERCPPKSDVVGSTPTRFAIHGYVAQQAEQHAVNVHVVGSNPTVTAI